jgi:hypothetical protein
MSLVTALQERRVQGEIALQPVGELDATCCTESRLEVYDFDAFARTLHGPTPATCDGVWARSDGGEFLVLLEMKSIKNMRLEFRHAHAEGGNIDEVAAYADFVRRKLLEYNFQAKIDGTHRLLSGIYNELDADIEHAGISAQFIFVHDLSSREIINFHSTLQSALDRIACPRWRPPAYTQCENIANEAAMVELMGGGPGE